MFHKVYYLRRGDVAFFRDNEQLVGSRIHEANKVEVGFMGSNGAQGKTGSVLVETTTGRGGGRRKRGGGSICGAV